jgi:hypothetical protein
MKKLSRNVESFRFDGGLPRTQRAGCGHGLHVYGKTG